MNEFALIPVIDLKGGAVVHAKGGMRADYRPIETPLGAAGDALAIARALLARDPVAGALRRRSRCDRRRRQSFRALPRSLRRATDTTLWIDAGFSNVTDCAFWLPLGTTFVIGTESLRHSPRIGRTSRAISARAWCCRSTSRGGAAGPAGTFCRACALARPGHCHEPRSRRHRRGARSRSAARHRGTRRIAIGLCLRRHARHRRSRSRREAGPQAR